MAFIPCNLGGGSSHDKSITLTSHSQVDLGEDHEYRYVTEMEHSATYTLAVGASAAQSQDMGTRHNYRYAKWPYLTVTIKGTTYAYCTTYYGSNAPYGSAASATAAFTISVNIKNKTYSLSGGSTGVAKSAIFPGANTNNSWGQGTAKITISSVTYT
jgi:hypothetical protein